MSALHELCDAVLRGPVEIKIEAPHGDYYVDVVGLLLRPGENHVFVETPSSVIPYYVTHLPAWRLKNTGGPT